MCAVRDTVLGCCLLPPDGAGCGGGESSITIISLGGPFLKYSSQSTGRLGFFLEAGWDLEAIAERVDEQSEEAETEEVGVAEFAVAVVEAGATGG
jgi:hypothetical protein